MNKDKLAGNCRICKNKFFKKPLLRYKNMPSVAQFLPDKDLLKKDKGVDLEIYQCSGCGLVQLNSNPVNYYRQVIRASGLSEEMKVFRMRQFTDFVRKFSLKGKKVIEIGCGAGEYLSIMKQAGVQAYGIEYSARLVSGCVNGGLKVQQGFIQNAGFQLKHAPFKGFFTLNFLEHLPDPNSFLRGIYNNLIDGAVGLVEVPNFDMILQKKLFSEFMRDHLFYFDKQTLNSTLASNGFEVIDSKVIWHDYIISAVVRKRKRLDISDFCRYQRNLKKEVENYIRKFGPKRTVIWGAGHQALAAISLLKLGNKISYVVDSAPFKQGKYTPATHLPIVSPRALNFDIPQAVIIMAASYSDEIAHILRKDFNKQINIAIMRERGLEIIK